MGAGILCEVCIDSAEAAAAATAGGAQRLEVCQALPLGGLTPGIGMFVSLRRRTALPLFAMVRGRAGDFVVDADDLRGAVEEARALRLAGADGIVFGALTPGGAVDEVAVGRVVAAAAPLPVTFHRAFDHVGEPLAALDRLVALGVARVLTSGGAPRAIDGAERIARCVGHAAGRLGIVAGGGVRPDHVAELVERTGVREVHLSAGCVLHRRGARPGSGARISGGALADDERFCCDPAVVRATVDALRAVR
ncbi:MAG: copper homeostasis protein CutC [Planctomycetes bacterium]|nr:copper homeostasis protein CutC [Planctomycetota bacterium]